MTGERKSSRPVADEMEAVAWGYDPDDDFISPLIKTASFFKTMPWEGEEDPGRPLTRGPREEDNEKSG